VIRVGPAGWSYADWEGIVYPREKPRGFHPLRHLARFVTCIEVNSSFYAVPRPDYAERWVREVEDRPDFRFSAKLQDVFTHHPLPPNDEELDALAHRWLGGIEPLRASGKLAAVLVQFPVGFRNTESGETRLARLRDAFGHLPLVLEVRHRSWFEPASLSRVRELGYSTAHIDLPSARDHPPETFPLTGPLGYVRAHGRNATSWFDARAGRDQRYDYLYPPGEVDELVAATRRIAGEVDETLVVTNNHFSGKAVANALDILASLGEEPPAAPPELVTAFPHLRARVRVVGQDSLF
jgi:uncharacterized protein YecE (DUF72 family)